MSEELQGPRITDDGDVERPISFLPPPVPSPKKRTHHPRTTKEEFRQRTRMVMLLIIEGRTKSYIKNFFKMKFQLRFRQIERYIRAARAQLVTLVNEDPQFLIAQSLGFYFSMMQDENVHPREKIKAREKADELLGLKSPIKIARTNSKGEDPLGKEIKGLSTDDIKTLISIGERAAGEIAGGGQSGASQN